LQGQRDRRLRNRVERRGPLLGEKKQHLATGSVEFQRAGNNYLRGSLVGRIGTCRSLANGTDPYCCLTVTDVLWAGQRFEAATFPPVHGGIGADAFAPAPARNTSSLNVAFNRRSNYQSPGFSIWCGHWHAAETVCDPWHSIHFCRTQR
jgi:hypothetical protein